MFVRNRNHLVAFTTILLSLCDYAYGMEQAKQESQVKQKPSLNFVINDHYRVQSFSARNGMPWAKTDKETHNACIWNALSLIDASKGGLFDAITEEQPSFAFETPAGKFVAKITPLAASDQTLSYFIKVVAAQNPK